MPDYDLKGLQASSKYQLSEMVGATGLPDDWTEFRSSAREICDHFLTLAAASLLADMKVDFFFQNLCRAAENWRRFASTSRVHYVRQVPLAYNAPILAAIIANEKSILQRIVLELPKQYLQGEEYEDQFLLTKILALLAARDCQPNEEIQANLAQLDDVALDSLKPALVKALLNLEDLTEDDFWSNFEVALYQHNEYVEAKLKSVATKISQFAAHRFIWFEGLVWLRLALIRGYTPPGRSIQYCPDEALEHRPRPFLNDWPLVPLAP